LSRPPYYMLSPYTTLFRSVTFNIDYIAAKNDPFIPIHPTSTTVNSVDKVIKIGYSGKKDSYDNYLKVEVRSYDTRTNQYTEWTKDRKSTRLNSSHVSISYA